MRDKRPVDELSIDELERILLTKKREARMQRFRGGESNSRAVMVADTPPPPMIKPAPQKPAPQSGQVMPEPVVLDDGGIPQFEDDLLPPDRLYPPIIGSSSQPNPIGRRVMNASLFLVEIIAIAGLFALLYLTYQSLTAVNEDREETQRLNATAAAVNAALEIRPTATPLITVKQVVLPGGHVWDASGQHTFNLNEVPAPYRTIFQEQLNAPRVEIQEDTTGGPIRLMIPAINTDVSVRAGDDWNALQASVGHSPFSSNPGVTGNMVLVGHNDIFGEVFKRLEELNVGDEIRVQSNTGQWYTYRVREKQVVEPTEVWVLDQNLGQDVPITTLITCYPYRVNTHRMIVFAELVG